MIVVLSFILGTIAASFLSVVATRVPVGRDILYSRSQCDFCKKTLSWYELIPVVSFVLQSGKCRSCKKKLSVLYPLGELGLGIAFSYAWTASGGDPGLFLTSCIFLSLGYIIVLSDLEHFLIPDFALMLMMLVQLVRMPAGTYPEHIASSIGAGMFFYLLWLVTKGKGMGFGDVKLVFVLGFILGFPLIVMALYTAFISGAIIGVVFVLIRKKGLKTRIPFGPFLLFGALFSLLFETELLRVWYTLTGLASG